MFEAIVAEHLEAQLKKRQECKERKQRKDLEAKIVDQDLPSLGNAAFSQVNGG
jgi:hypothetical protein